MTKLIYLTNSYLKTHTAKIMSIVKKGTHYEVILDETIFYPIGGGQPSDKGLIQGKNGQFEVSHVRMHDTQIVHEGKLTGKLSKDDHVTCSIDWNLRWQNMQLHSAGHILHEVIMKTIPGISPIKANHGKNAFIEYDGLINPKLLETLEKQTNMLSAQDKSITQELVNYQEIINRGVKIWGDLPKNKPLRLITIEGFAPIPDGGTQVLQTSELGLIKIKSIETTGLSSKVYYDVDIPNVIPVLKPENTKPQFIPSITLVNLKTMIMDMEREILNLINQTQINNLEELKIKYFGSNGKATNLIKNIKDLPQNDRKSAGLLINQFKTIVMDSFNLKMNTQKLNTDWFDISLPGIQPPQGYLHLVTQAISEITQIFASIGFTRVRYPEIDWDWYAFESLNMPKNHPARDEWETFHIENSKFEIRNSKLGKMVLTPHTSNGQVREMERHQPPIKMINIAKCYRRQIDVSHTPMFHQFEGMYIDKNVSIGHLKGVCDYFFKNFYGPDRISRLRPFHFQFTEPSFEIDVTCGICNGTGKIVNGNICKLCKDGWLELGGAGMVHPNVIKSAGLDPEIYNGFAFGWGVERTYMMKAGTQIDDIRPIYNNDLRFLEQF